LDTFGAASTRNKIVEYEVEKIGSERILFGTDTYASGFQRGRIEYALITDDDKMNILLNNAAKLFAKNIL
jgi:predicted TIM-barrel fold metal-dependent hydrolase